VTFERPVALLLLLAIPLAACLYVVLQRRRMRYSMHFTNLAVLREVAGRRSWRRHVPAALFALALAALLVGVARPHVRGLVLQDRATVVLVLDISRSMEATDVKPSRLVAAKRAARRFLERAPDRVRVGLVVFAGVPQVAAPATTDRAQVIQSLDHLAEFASLGGTAIGDAIALAVEHGQETLERDLADPEAAPDEGTSEDDASLASILFLSDGAQRRGILQPLEGAQIAKEARMPVYTVALGTPDGMLESFGGGFGGGGFGGGGFDPTGPIPVPPDPVTLRAIAEETGGEFTEARDAETLSSAYEELGSTLGRQEADKEVTHLFLLAAAGLLVAAGILGSAWLPRLP
jgi:Ca-activated chloride channel homolog